MGMGMTPASGYSSSSSSWGRSRRSPRPSTLTRSERREWERQWSPAGAEVSGSAAMELMKVLKALLGWLMLSSLTGTHPYFTFAWSLNNAKCSICERFGLRLCRRREGLPDRLREVPAAPRFEANELRPPPPAPFSGVSRVSRRASRASRSCLSSTVLFCAGRVSECRERTPCTSDPSAWACSSSSSASDHWRVFARWGVALRPGERLHSALAVFATTRASCSMR